MREVKGKMLKVHIEKLEIYAYHGVFSQEKDLGQKFLIDLDILLKDKKSLKDDIENTINYGELASFVCSFALENTFDLIESLADKIAMAILFKYDLAKSVKVKIHKPNAPVKEHFEDIYVEVERKKILALIGLGSNMGDRKKNIGQAIRHIEEISNLGIYTEIRKKASLIETRAWGKEDQADFINTVIEVETALSPHELLEELLAIEKKMGRLRKEKWGPRNIDLDILLFDDEIICEDNLVIPHPYLHKREFVLESLKEIAPNKTHPVMKKSMKDLFEKVKNS